MIIIVFLIALTVFGFIFDYFKKKKNQFYEKLFGPLASLFLGLALIVLIIIRADYAVEIEKFHAAKSTIYYQRQLSEDQDNYYERAALAQTIIEYNAWLAGAQRYVSDPWIGWFIPNSVLFLTPIE
jgi:hypothetical protein